MYSEQNVLCSSCAGAVAPPPSALSTFVIASATCTHDCTAVAGGLVFKDKTVFAQVRRPLRRQQEDLRCNGCCQALGASSPADREEASFK